MTYFRCYAAHPQLPTIALHRYHPLIIELLIPPPTAIGVNNTNLKFMRFFSQGFSKCAKHTLKYWYCRKSLQQIQYLESYIFTFLNMKCNYDNVHMEIEILVTTNTWIIFRYTCINMINKMFKGFKHA